jgi:hypothetical protein
MGGGGAEDKVVDRNKWEAKVVGGYSSGTKWRGG